MDLQSIQAAQLMGEGVVRGIRVKLILNGDEEAGPIIFLLEGPVGFCRGSPVLFQE